MNAYLRLESSELWQLAGWTMLHFLWLGVAVALLAAVSRLVLRRAAPAVRYAVALSCFALLAAAPGGIAAWLVAHRPAVEATTLQIAAANMPAQPQTYGKGVPTAGTDIEFPTYAVPLAPGSASQPADMAEQLAPAATLPAYAAAVLATCVPYLPWLWIVGAPITFALLATGVVGADRLRRTSHVISDGLIAEACQRLLEQLRITRRVTVALCERIAAPVLVGVLRPVILLPPAALTGWSPDEIEMVLLHELAHVRRWDNLVNLLQRLVESLLFFHPVVWLLSGWVRREREACCDAVVVGRTNRPHAYAEMLVALAAQMPRSVLFHPAASSAMAAGPLRSRIRRILQLEDDPMLISGKSLTLAVGSLVLVTALMVLYLPARGSAEESAAKAKGLATEVTENTETEQVSEVGQQIEMETAAGEHVVAESQDGRLRVQIRNRRSGQFPSLERQSPADDWPASLGEPPRANRVIAEKAWQRLGLKLLPTTAEEREELQEINQFPAGVKIVGGNVPDGLPLPAYLVQLDGQRLGSQMFHNFNQLRLWLESEDGKSDAPAKCAVFADGESFLLEARPPESKQIQTETTPEASSTRARFPSLEDQKLADLAWKSLGLELEQIGPEDLQRVQALGYDGGLKVAGSQFGRSGIGENGIWNGDILVGLHVWPTTSYQAVAEVLNRDDLQELNPLKFYVVRPGSTGGRGANSRGGRGRGEIDTVVTGRIVVGPAVTGEYRPPNVEQTIDIMVPTPPGRRREAERRLPQDPFDEDLEIRVEVPAAVALPEVPRLPGQPPSPPAAPEDPSVLFDPLSTSIPSVPETRNAPQSSPAQGATLDLQFRSPTTSALPYAVRFEQGASRFLDGDKIKVLEVRGTAETFEPGNVYWIKGTYKLGSHDRAKLDAYITATEAGDGISNTWRIQTTTVDRGNGTFELFLPMTYRGWPHVSFYPTDGGEGFGGTYFGTGDTVLKKWWESKDVTDRTVTDGFLEASNNSRMNETRTVIAWPTPLGVSGQRPQSPGASNAPFAPPSEPGPPLQDEDLFGGSEASAVSERPEHSSAPARLSRGVASQRALEEARRQLEIAKLELQAAAIELQYAERRFQAVMRQQNAHPQSDEIEQQIEAIKQQTLQMNRSKEELKRQANESTERTPSEASPNQSPR